MKITPRVDNEWGDLDTIIVGNVENAQIPTIKDKSLRCIDYAHLTDAEFESIPTGSYPTRVIEETQEDLGNLEATLKELGVNVIRPPKLFTEKERPFTDSYYDYCPRDSMLVVKDRVIKTPMALHQRRTEADKYREIFHDSSWTEFPTSLDDNHMYSVQDLSRPTLMDGPVPIFDAANVLKANNDLLYLVSNTGNEAGADYLQDWLRNNISSDYNVHKVKNVYAYIHIDTTFVLLREGLVLCNPARVNKYNMPAFLRNWDRIWAPEPYPTQVMDDWCPASPWLGMNILSVNQNQVIVEEHQVSLMNLLKKYNIDPIPVKMRHSRTLSGGPHCVTLDVIRK